MGETQERFEPRSVSPIWTPEHSSDEDEDEMTAPARRVLSSVSSDIQDNLTQIGDKAKIELSKAIESSKEKASHLYNESRVQATKFIEKNKIQARNSIGAAKERLEKARLKLEKLAAKIDFAWWMTVSNISSTALTLGYYGGVISLEADIIGELAVFLVKTGAEWYYEQLDSKLLVHHLSACFMFYIGWTRKDWMGHYIPWYNTIHLPLLFYNARNMYPDRTHPRHILAQRLFLWTWLPVCGLRVAASYHVATCHGNLPLGAYFGAASIPILDFMWTPWHRYRRMLNGNPWVRKSDQEKAARRKSQPLLDAVPEEATQ